MFSEGLAIGPVPLTMSFAAGAPHTGSLVFKQDHLFFVWFEHLSLVHFKKPSLPMVGSSQLHVLCSGTHGPAAHYAA